MNIESQIRPVGLPVGARVQRDAPGLGLPERSERGVEPLDTVVSGGPLHRGAGQRAPCGGPVDEDLKVRSSGQIGVVDREPVRREGEAAKGRRGARAESLHPVGLQVRVPAGYHVYPVTERVAVLVLQERVANPNEVLSLGRVHPEQAGRVGGPAPGGAERQIVVQPVAVGGVERDRLADIAIVVLTPRQRSRSQPSRRGRVVSAITEKRRRSAIRDAPP